jgi:hypothetical protein
MANDDPLWEEIAKRYSLLEPDLRKLASPWHTGLDLGRPIEVMTDMKTAEKEASASLGRPSSHSWICSRSSAKID